MSFTRAAPLCRLGRPPEAEQEPRGRTSLRCSLVPVLLATKSSAAAASPRCHAIAAGFAVPVAPPRTVKAGSIIGRINRHPEAPRLPVSPRLRPFPSLRGKEEEEEKKTAESATGPRGPLALLGAAVSTAPAALPWNPASCSRPRVPTAAAIGAGRPLRRSPRYHRASCRTLCC